MRARLSQFWNRLSRLWRNKPEPQDPYASVGSPLRRGPSGRSGAIALAEPDPDQSTRALGKTRF